MSEMQKMMNEFVDEVVYRVEVLLDEKLKKIMSKIDIKMECFENKLNQIADKCDKIEKFYEHDLKTEMNHKNDKTSNLTKMINVNETNEKINTLLKPSEFERESINCQSKGENITEKTRSCDKDSMDENYLIVDIAKQELKPDRENFVKMICNKVLKKEIEFSNVEVVFQKPERSVLKFKCRNLQDKIQLLKNRHLLKGTSVYLKDFLSDDELIVRRLLFKEIKSKTKAEKILIKKDTVIIDGKALEWKPVRSFLFWKKKIVDLSSQNG